MSQCICGGGGFSGGGGVVMVVVVVWYSWWWFHSGGGGGCGMGLCKGSSFNSCSSAIVECTIHGEGGDKGDDEVGGGGDRGGFSYGDGGGQEKNHNNQL